VLWAVKWLSKPLSVAPLEDVGRSMIHQEAHHGSKSPCADSATLTCFDCLAPSFNTSAQIVGSAYGSDV